MLSLSVLIGWTLFENCVASAFQRPLPSQIVVAAGASEVELWAASMLSQQLGLPTTTVNVTVNATSRMNLGEQIGVGHGAAVALGVPADVLGKLSDDAYLVATGPARGIESDSVAIASSPGSARGTMNGAFAFLRKLGFEFLAQDETIVPAGALQLPVGLNLLYAPPMESRDIDSVSTAGPGGERNFHIPYPNQQATNLSAALGYNGPTSFGPVGGRVGPLAPPGFVGTAYNLLSKSGSSQSCGAGQENATSDTMPCPAVAVAHPEWFACMSPSGPYPYGNHINLSHTTWPCPQSGPNSLGKPYMSQPCWGNASLISAITSNIRGLIQQYPNQRIINLGGLDGTSTFIQCPTDVPFMLAANSTGGANFHAANVIAKALASEHPDVLIMIDAYELTQFPPQVGYRFHPNVIVRVCLTGHMGYDGDPGTLPGTLPLTDPRNAEWIEWLKRWTAAANRVYIWEYTYHGAYTLTPYSNYFVVAENLKTLNQLGVKGWYAEGVCCQPGEEMVGLKVYLWGRLAFNPSLDTMALTEQYLRGFYGPQAAPYILTYLQIMDVAMRAHGGGRPGTPRPWTANTPASRAEAPWSWGPYAACFSNNTVLDAAEALAKAQATTGADPKRALRVAQARLALQFIAFYRWKELRAYASANGRMWPFQDQPLVEFEEFAQTMNQSGTGPPGRPGRLTVTQAALAINGSKNGRGQVSVDELRIQLQRSLTDQPVGLRRDKTDLPD